MPERVMQQLRLRAVVGLVARLKDYQWSIQLSSQPEKIFTFCCGSQSLLAASEHAYRVYFREFDTGHFQLCSCYKAAGR